MTTATSTASDIEQAAYDAAREWFVLRGEKYPDAQPAIRELAAIIVRRVTASNNQQANPASE